MDAGGVLVKIDILDEDTKSLTQQDRWNVAASASTTFASILKLKVGGSMSSNQSVVCWLPVHIIIECFIHLLSSYDTHKRSKWIVEIWKPGKFVHQQYPRTGCNNQLSVSEYFAIPSRWMRKPKFILTLHFKTASLRKLWTKNYSGTVMTPHMMDCQHYTLIQSTFYDASCPAIILSNFESTRIKPTS